MDVKRERSIFRLLPRNSNFTWFLVTFALKFPKTFFFGVALGAKFELALQKRSVIANHSKSVSIYSTFHL